ncbi:lysM domain receptor-like kinase 3 [Phoenix dactylifera]|uniref:LysM domain receptor-like kinase 3 n=1 Tax=Phoenix dactylifera TaxID=42345 RepID=A0A8B8J5W7_PHODC|nr:lysM domain receptor-like kinase 3 [Phoenix dactylifera]
MAKLLFFLLSLLSTNISKGAAPSLAVVSIKSILIKPIRCSSPSPIPICSSYLYVDRRGLPFSEIASKYSADASLMKAIARPTGEADLLVEVPCVCEETDNTTSSAFLLHDTKYTVQNHETPDGVTTNKFSGLAWDVGGGANLTAGEITVHLPCGCSAADAGVELVSYAVHDGDTLTTIADLLSSDASAIQGMNSMVTNPDFLSPGWVLFVPMRSSGSPQTSSGRKGKKIAVILGISLSMAFLVVSGIIIIICLRNRIHRHNREDLKKKMNKTTSAKSIAALESQYLPNKTAEDVQPFESERPVIFSLEVVEGATANFDETRKIGEGGYGSVYFGMIGNQEVAIKKMKSSKSKEFFAELKVLCKVHHINVVELIGYAAGDDNLYLVYEYVQNGSLSEHLHDPLLKGHQPLSWNARAQIALDAARGIEYIHDHTKARYVHRDIKTSNILLDGGLRAKVADFGLAKFVERSGEDDCIATRLVGTPGYLPPELVRELQMTTKTDVFAFGVVLAELITGHRALLRDNKEPTYMKSLISIMKGIFQEDDPESALEAVIDRNLNDSYPAEEIYKMADISMWCLSDDPLDRPEMREITVKLAQILMASIEWEASLGGNSQVFSGVFNGR